jgi:acetolactate synthase-1/2/3 large subunit
MPVVESPAATLACFPKSHALFVGQDLAALRDDIDLALLVECRAPWYPPSNAPRNATIVVVAANPLKTTMVHQVMAAGHYLEGDPGLSLELLIEAVRQRRPDPAAIAQRRERWSAEHRKWRERLDAAERAAAAAQTITVPLVARLLREKMPADTIVVDETIVHARVWREHTLWSDPFGFFRAPSGLGQGLGYALGIKLALPQRPVVVTIGDGTFMYNPVVPAISFADAHSMPLLILICNNAKYAAMQFFHDKFYPAGSAIAAQDYYGVNIPDARYERAAAIVEGYGRRVATPAELSEALDEAIATLAAGKTAIINMIMPGKMR